MNVDPTGRFLLSMLIGAIIGAIVSATASVIEQLITTGTVDLVQVLISAAFGAISGALMVTGIGGPMGQFLIQGGISAVEHVAVGTYTGEGFSLESIMFNFIAGGLVGLTGSIKGASVFKAGFSLEKSLMTGFKSFFLKPSMKVVNLIKNIISSYIKEYVYPLIKPIIRDIIDNVIRGLASNHYATMYDR